MDKTTFLGFVLKVEEKLRAMSIEQKEKFTRKTSPTEYEKLVEEASKYVINANNYDCEIEYTEGGHAFPDIIYTFNKNEKFGIEVKSSTNTNSPDNSWTILGNSILGSTKVEVLDIYIMFIKVNKNGCFVKSARYEDSVSDVVVTHSPRYKINLVQESKDSFFSRSGISYDSMNDSDDPIGLITNYFREQGQTAWWIAESTPAVIKTWAEVSPEEKNDIIATAFILFPELISSTGPTKYKRLAKWLAANYSIVDSSLRDNFTAGGRLNIEVNFKKFFRMPRIFESLLLHLEAFNVKIKELSLDEIQQYWVAYPSKSDNSVERVNHWYSTIKNDLKNENKTLLLEFLLELFPKIYRP
jgi:hypothetical protein